MRNPRTVVAAILFLGLHCSVGDVCGHEASLGRRTSSLGWVRLEGAEECIAASALARSVEERLGRKVFVSAAEADLNIEGSIGAFGKKGFRATLRVTSRDGSVLGEREVETREGECGEIDEKLSLVLSILIDPDAGYEPAVEASPSKPAPEPPKVIERERVVVVRVAEPKAPEPWRYELSASVMGTIGVQPGVGVAFAPSLIVRPPGFWGVFAGGAVASPSATSSEHGARAESSLTHGAVALCPVTTYTTRIHSAACAGGLIGALSTRGTGFDRNLSGYSMTAGPLVMGRVSAAVLPPIAVGVGVSLLVPLWRAVVGYQVPEGGSSPLFRTAPVAGMAEVGVTVRLP